MNWQQRIIRVARRVVLAGAIFGTVACDDVRHQGRTVSSWAADLDAKDAYKRRQACEAGVLQIIGRGRGVNRTPADPLEVVVLANLALGLDISELKPWRWPMAILPLPPATRVE